MIIIIKFLFPILVYLVAEWFFDPLAAAGIAAGLAIVQMLIELAAHRRFNPSYLYDAAIVCVLGAIEYFGQGESKWLMWVVAPLLMVVLILASMSKKINVWGSASEVVLARVRRNPYTWSLFLRSSKRMAWWCIVASALSLVPLLSPKSEVAAWLDSYMLIFLIVGYIATEIVAARIEKYKYRKAEWVPLMNEDGKVTGVAPRPLVHNGSHWLHPVVHLHVFSHGRLLLQLRPQTKKIQPGKWDTAVGGHIAAGEKLEQALGRETWEEIGIKDFDVRFVQKYAWHCEVEDEYVFAFKTINDGPYEPKNPGEVDELRLWTKEELAAQIGKGVFTPNLEHELIEWLLNDEEFDKK